MGERGLGIRSGVNKLGWEETDFPIVCNSCLGDNPYIRMLKIKFARSCRICDRPHTVFKWRPSRHHKPKMVEICQTCGKLKNICQSCLRDLDFNMSMTERDEFLGDKKIEIPAFEANRDYWAEQANKNLQRLVLPYNELMPAMEGILNEPRIVPSEEYALACPHTHFHDQQFQQDQRQLRDQKDSGTLKDLLTKDEFKPQGILPPDDPKISSLYVSHMTLDITVGDIREVFSRYGEIKSLKMMPHGQTCFVNFIHRSSAENAINCLFNNLAIKDIELKVQWARQANKQFAVGQILNSMQPEKQGPVALPQGNHIPVPPKMPPPNVTKAPIQENDYLLEIMRNQAQNIYPSQDPYMNGGVRRENQKQHQHQQQQQQQQQQQSN